MTFLAPCERFRHPVSSTRQEGNMLERPGRAAADHQHGARVWGMKRASTGDRTGQLTLHRRQTEPARRLKVFVFIAIRRSKGRSTSGVGGECIGSQGFTWGKSERKRSSGRESASSLDSHPPNAVRAWPRLGREGWPRLLNSPPNDITARLDFHRAVTAFCARTHSQPSSH
jgi:hypothetical protein